jgi:exonuclease III
MGDEDCPTSPITSLRANDSSVIKPNFRVYSHNVNGLRDEQKLEYLPRIMKDQKIDAYLIQETHLEGDFEKKILNDFLFIHHGPPKQPPQGAKGGVGIILSPELAYQWKTLEKKRKINKIKRGGLSTGNTTRFMALTISFEIPKGELRLNKNVKYHNLVLISCYFPHSGYKENELDSFANDWSEFLSTTANQKNSTTIIGADINSSIGNKTSLLQNPNSTQDKHDSPLDFDPIEQLIGPHGNPQTSKNSHRILNIMRSHNLRAASTFFDNNRKYNTWLSPPTAPTMKRNAYQLDHILIPKNQLCYTQNVKRRFDGAHSDHAALRIDFRLLTTPLLKNKQNLKNKKTKPTTINNFTLHNQALTTFQTKVLNFFNNLPMDTAIYATPSDIMNSFE